MQEPSAAQQHGDVMNDEELALPKLEQAGTVERAAQLIRENIIQGSIPPGKQLRIAALAEQLGTSQGSIREAIRILASESLVEHRHNRGAFVKGFSSDDCLEVYAAREAVETWAVRWIVDHVDELDLAPVANALERMLVTEHSTDTIEADMDFHHSIVKLTGNERLTEFHSSLIAESEILLRTYRPFPESSFHTIHRQVLEALQTGDIVAADLLRSHFLSSSQLINSKRSASMQDAS